MVLQGTFETLALPELLGLLASARKSGALRLEAGPVSGVIHLEDGHCRAVETSEQLGQVQDGPALLTRLVDVCFAVTRQENGAFRFASDEPAPWRSEEPAELSDALVEVDRLLKQWREILNVIPSLDCRPRLLEAMQVDEIVVDRDRWALLVGIDGRRSVHDLVHRADRPVIDVCHWLLELIEAGAVGVLDPAAAAPPAAAPAPPAPAPTAPVAPAPPAAAPAAPPAPSAPPVAPASNGNAAQPATNGSAPQPATNGDAAQPAPTREPGPREPEQPDARTPEPPAEPRPAAEPSGDETSGGEGGEAPDRGAFLRLFSGLRDG